MAQLKTILNQKTTRVALVAFVLVIIGLADGKISVEVGVQNIVDNIVTLATIGLGAYAVSLKGESK